MRVHLQMRFALAAFTLAGTACSSANSAPQPTATVANEHAPATPTRTKIDARSSTYGNAANRSRVNETIVLAAIDDGIASDQPIHARLDQRVTLYAAIIAEHSGKRIVYTDAAKAQLDGKTVTTEPLANGPVVELRWNRIEPAVSTMTNGDGRDFRFREIDYRATPIAAGKPSILADVRPTLTPDHGNGVGTMRFQLVALQGDRVIASPGPEARRGRGSGGLTDEVMRVSIRRDDTYLGYLTEMYGQPYIWASAGLGDRAHQSERLEGSDCADFVVYGARRLGKALPYTWTGELPKVTKLLAAGSRGVDGIYRDAKGKPLPFTAVGDLLLWPRHVGALAADRGTVGTLDDEDLVMHTFFDSPKEVRIADSGYADKPLEVRRLPR